jgi:hypothetical protein
VIDVSVLVVFKASDIHIFYLLFTTALVFSVICMIGGIFNYFIKCLDPSSM